MKAIEFKKGDKVRVLRSGANASRNNIHNFHLPIGVYSLNTWKDEIFEITGNWKKEEYLDICPSITGAYELSLEGKLIGYVYNTALKLAIPQSMEDKIDWLKNIINQDQRAINDWNNISNTPFTHAKRQSIQLLRDEIQKAEEIIGILTHKTKEAQISEVKSYKKLIKEIAELYSENIKDLPSNTQKLIAFELHEDLASSLGEKRLHKSTANGKI